MRKFSLRLEPAASEVKGKCANHLATEAPCMAHKPMVTLRNTLTKVKDPTDTKTRIGTVYKVICAECPTTYIGETGRTLDCRIKEHKQSTEKQDVVNIIAVNHMETNHRIDWE